MAESDKIPQIDPSEIEVLIQKIEQNKLRAARRAGICDGPPFLYLIFIFAIFTTPWPDNTKKIFSPNPVPRISWRSHSTIYLALLKLEQEGYIASDWDVSDNNRKAKYYKLTRAGRKRLAQETQKWEITTEILGRFFTPLEEP